MLASQPRARELRMVVRLHFVSDQFDLDPILLLTAVAQKRRRSSYLGAARRCRPAFHKRLTHHRAGETPAVPVQG